jgi:hypothetical protein
MQDPESVNCMGSVEARLFDRPIIGVETVEISLSWPWRLTVSYDQGIVP